MNGFRVTLLVLLTLTIGLMYYAIIDLIPAKQQEFEMYKAGLKLDEYQQRNQEHLARMEQLGPDVESPEVLTARTAAEEAQKQREQAINDAEETSVLAAARRKQETENAKTVADAKAAAADSASFPMGHVASYDAEWNILMFTVQTNKPLEPGKLIAVRKKGTNYTVCEAIVDSLDEQSGQISATLKPNPNPAKDENGQDIVPGEGDEIIESPFATGNDAIFSVSPTGTDSGFSPSPAASETVPLPANDGPAEIDAQLVPLP